MHIRQVINLLRRLVLLPTICCMVSASFVVPGVSGEYYACAQTVKLGDAEATVVVEPYAPNIVRVSISLLKPYAEAAPGYGITAKPFATDWTRERTSHGEILRSPRMIVTTSLSDHTYKPTGTQADIAKFFNGSTPGVGLSFKTPEGATLLQMTMADVRPQSQGRQLADPQRSSPHRPALLSGWRHLRLSRR